MEGRGCGILSTGDQRRRDVWWLQLHSVWPEPDGCRLALRWRLLAFVARILSHVAVYAYLANGHCAFTLWCFAVWRDVSICGVPCVLANVAEHELDVAVVQPYFSPILADLSDVQPNIAYVLSNVATLLWQYFSELQPCVAALLSHLSALQPQFADASVANIS